MTEYNLNADPTEYRYLTPRTVASRYEDGRVNVLLFTEGKNAEGIYGFLMCSSTRVNGKWTRLWEHPQEWDVCGDDEEDDKCPYCGQKCWEGEMCDEQQAGGFSQ